MARNPELDAALEKIDDGTNRLGSSVSNVSTALDGVSTRVFALTEKIKTSMTPEEVASVKNSIDIETDKIDASVVAFNDIATAMNGIAVDADVPVPEIPAPVVI